MKESPPPITRLEPWSTEAPLCAARRILVSIAKQDVARVQLRLAHSGQEAYRTGLEVAAGAQELWELPIPGPSETTPDHDLELQVGTRTERIRLAELRAALSAGRDFDPGRGHEIEIGDVEETSWDTLLDHHVERIGSWSESNTLRPSVLQGEGLVEVPWTDFLTGYWETNDRDSEPPRHLIVRIAQECVDWVEDLCQRPHKILRRHRQLTPLSRAQDVDDACIRWLSRQPGRRLAERAGPRQRVLAVLREESIDTPENRVLRDFLRLSIRAAKRYLRIYTRYTESRRLGEVRVYCRKIEHLLRDSAVAQVPQLAGSAHRNYVLQFDPRYSRLWDWYDRLRRQEDDRDNLASWKHRLWSEYCELVLYRGCDELSLPQGSFASPAILRHEADRGCFLDVRTSQGPWSLQVGRPGELLQVTRRGSLLTDPSLAVRGMGSLAPDLVFTRKDCFVESSVRASLAVWTIFSPDDDDQMLRTRLERLEAALLAAGAPRVRGILLVPARNGASQLQESPKGRVAAVRLGLPGSQNLQHVWPHLSSLLSSFVAGRQE